MTKTLSLLIFCFRLTVEETLSDRLLKAPDDASVSRLLADNTAALTPDLFESCRKPAQSMLDRRENTQALRGFQTALAVAKALPSDRSAAVSLRGTGIALARLNQGRQALVQYEEGLKFATVAGDSALQAELLRGIRVASRSLGDLPRSIDGSNADQPGRRRKGSVRRGICNLSMLELGQVEQRLNTPNRHPNWRVGLIGLSSNGKCSTPRGMVAMYRSNCCDSHAGGGSRGFVFHAVAYHSLPRS